MTVSYTHLDVYKRQGLGKTIQLLAVILSYVQKNKGNVKPSIIICPSSLAPVSYTHLDVYKRQHLYETRDKQTDLITYTVAPQSFYTCSDNCLEKVSKIASKYNLPVHVHFLESIDEIEDIKYLIIIINS